MSSWFTPEKDRCPAAVERDDKGIPDVTITHPLRSTMPRIQARPPKLLVDEPIRRITACYEKIMAKDFAGKDVILRSITEFNREGDMLTESVRRDGAPYESMKLIETRCKVLVSSISVILPGDKAKREIVQDYIWIKYWIHYINIQSANIEFEASPEQMKKKANAAERMKMKNAEMAKKAWKTTATVIRATAPLSPSSGYGSSPAMYGNKSRKNRKGRKNSRKNRRNTRKY